MKNKYIKKIYKQNNFNYFHINNNYKLNQCNLIYQIISNNFTTFGRSIHGNYYGFNLRKLIKI